MALFFRTADVTAARLDPWHYQPRFVSTRRSLRSCGSCRELGELIDPKRGVKSGATPLGAEYPDAGTIRFYRTADVRNLCVQRETAAFLTDEQDRALARSRLQAGDILLTITGVYFGQSGVVGPEHVPGNISQHSVRFGLRDGYDDHYVVAYLASSSGQDMIWRQAYGATRPAIDFPGVRSILVRTPHVDAQRYIGDKVRQAERLRERARRLYSELIQPFDAMVSSEVRALGASRSWRVPASGLENRLDPGANHVRLGALRRELRAAGRVRALGDLVQTPLVAGVSLSTFTPDGPRYIRISDFDRGYWDTSAAAVSSRDHRSNAKGHLQPGDTVFARIGNTLGKVGFADQHVPTSSLSNNCSLLRPIDQDHGAWIFWCLRSAIGQVQASCLRSQTAQPKIANDDIESIILPDPQARPRSFNEQTQEHFFAARTADALTRVATLLVERLIEGKVTETDLVAAQTALESGDRGPDRAILHALRQNANPAQPLIVDLDGLYALLDELEEEANA